MTENTAYDRLTAFVEEFWASPESALEKVWNLRLPAEDTLEALGLASSSTIRTNAIVAGIKAANNGEASVQNAWMQVEWASPYKAAQFVAYYADAARKRLAFLAMSARTALRETDPTDPPLYVGAAPVLTSDLLLPD